MADLEIGQSKRFDYTGTVQSINLLPGTYKLECYGAQGGAGGRNGGKSIGYYKVKRPGNLYIVCGGKGADNSGNAGGAGGFNGGGRGGNGYGYRGGGGGGGATHIATTNRGLLRNYASYQDEVIIVAGGGGGVTSHSSAGAGGGTSGGNGSAHNGATVKGGTQTTGYAFGEGQAGKSKEYHGSYGAEGNGGGGGGWYGGYAYQANGNSTDCGGAGGSGYIGGVLSTVTIDDITYTSSTTSNANSGNGYAIITYLKDGAFIVCTNCTATTGSSGHIDESFEYDTIDEPIEFDVFTDGIIIEEDKICYVDNIRVNPETLSVQKVGRIHYKVTIPPNSDYIVYIRGLLTESRLNSDFYKNIQQDPTFDFEKLFDDMEI